MPRDFVTEHNEPLKPPARHGIAMNSIKYLGIHFPKSILLLIIGITTLFGAQLPKLIVDTNTMFLAEEHPARQRFERVQTDFTGMNDSIMVVVSSPEKGMFGPDGIELIKRLTGELEKLTFIDEVNERELQQVIRRLPQESQPLLRRALEDGIARDDYPILLSLYRQAANGDDLKLAYALRDAVAKIQPIRKVTSLTNMEELFPENETFVVDDFIRSIPTSEHEARALREEGMANPMLYKSLIGDDGNSLAIRVEGRIDPEDAVNMRLLYEKVNTLTSARHYHEYDIHLAGLPVMAAASAAVSERDTGIYFPVVILVVLGIILLYLRSASRVAIPLVVVILSIIWTMGLMALIGVKQNIISSMMPVFLIAIGIVDSIHILSEYDNQVRAGKDHRSALSAMMDNEFHPVLVTSLTSAVAFLFLAWTEIIYVRDFGLFVAFGIMAAMLLSLYFIPAVIALVKPKPAPAMSETKGMGRVFSCMRRGFVRATHTMIQHRTKALAILGAIFIVAVYGAAHVTVDNQSVSYFPADSEIRIADNYVNAHYGGTIPLNVILTAQADGAFYDPENLSVIEQLQQSVLQLPEVDYSISIADYIKRINYKFHSEDPAYYRLPSDSEAVPLSAVEGLQAEAMPGRDQVAQFALMYEMAGGNTLWDVVSRDFSKANTLFMVKSDRATTLGMVKDEINTAADRVGLNDLTMSFGGYGDLLEVTVDEITKGQIISLVLTVPVMLLMMLLLFRRVGYAVAGLVPFAITITAMFAIMAMAGVDVNIGTSILASIAIGTGIDFAIHYISRFHDAREQGATPIEACASAAELSGVPIFMGSISIAAGFLVLLLSEFGGVSSLGWLVATAMLFSMLVTILFMPVLLTSGSAAIVPAEQERCAKPPESNG